MPPPDKGREVVAVQLREDGEWVPLEFGKTGSGQSWLVYGLKADDGLVWNTLRGWAVEEEPEQLPVDEGGGG